MQSLDPLTTAEKQDLLEQLSVSIEPIRLSSSYRVGLLIVASTMVILPVLYVVLVAGAGWLVYMHATQNTWILDGGGRLRALMYGGPIVIGGIVPLHGQAPLFTTTEASETPPPRS